MQSGRSILISPPYLSHQEETVTSNAVTSKCKNGDIKINSDVLWDKVGTSKKQHHINMGSGGALIQVAPTMSQPGPQTFFKRPCQKVGSFFK